MTSSPGSWRRQPTFRTTTTTISSSGSRHDRSDHETPPKEIGRVEAIVTVSNIVKGSEAAAVVAAAAAGGALHADVAMR